VFALPALYPYTETGLGCTHAIFDLQIANPPPLQDVFRVVWAVESTRVLRHTSFIQLPWLALKCLKAYILSARQEMYR